ncbi:hypothetical protein PTSG_09693 [Salpingoeca rosetta]|uniref:Uncharacterized protein n=1 Tax=Salpingoeca rosetta (strain ATCC 50818 / BSB-021) TaxID=946362 RepID=F2UNS1_SALR5|nr:uncharacterized protein PTSG_09693 [Salpingoeca rosetta]EGD79276.1 hypothetical protein PTSG_09693 [Salpingoeca rosetta]|eukprot:XP_004989047.1 hypothetical protein PTSG_09693 [Salpingoeca rosetta]
MTWRSAMIFLTMGRAVVVVVVVVLVLLAAGGEAGAAQQDRATITQDEQGSISIDVPGGKPVFLNGVNAVAVLRAQQEAVAMLNATIAAQESMVAVNEVALQQVKATVEEQDAQITALRSSICRRFTPTNPTYIPVVNTFDAWSGGVLANNNKIYGIPYNEHDVLVIETTSNTVSKILLQGASGDHMWQGGVLAGNGKIYACPNDATSVLTINPATNSATTSVITGLGLAGDKWSGGALADNGKIYCVPHDALAVLVIDPASDSADATTLEHMSPVGSTNLWAGAVRGNDGNIYGVPYSAATILKINPITDEITHIYPGLRTGGNKWRGGVIGRDGLLYCIPYRDTRMLVSDLNINNHTFYRVADEADSSYKWEGGALGSNGRIYGAPSSASAVLMFDPATSTADTTSLAIGAPAEPSQSRKWDGLVAAPNGLLYGIPRNSDHVLVIDPRCHF